uniref:MgtE domain-containing protein n=1 Tax=Panagrellus redivivus TaxID=6233 RepID=A0A7E4ZVM6_PANRE
MHMRCLFNGMANDFFGSSCQCRWMEAFFSSLTGNGPTVAPYCQSSGKKGCRKGKMNATLTLIQREDKEKLRHRKADGYQSEHSMQALKRTITPRFTGNTVSSSSRLNEKTTDHYALLVTLLLFVCQWLVAMMWTCRVDPDNAAIPYLTALGDLIGTVLLFGAFSFLHCIGDEEIIKS